MRYVVFDKYYNAPVGNYTKFLQGLHALVTQLDYSGRALRPSAGWPSCVVP